MQFEKKEKLKIAQNTWDKSKIKKSFQSKTTIHKVSVWYDFSNVKYPSSYEIWEKAEETQSFGHPSILGTICKPNNT